MSLSDLLPELQGIIYGLVETQQLTRLYLFTSKATTSEIDAHPHLLQRIEGARASCIKDYEDRDKYLKARGEYYLQQKRIDVAVVLAPCIQVGYMKVRLRCAIGNVLATEGKRDAAQAIFAEARKEAATQSHSVVDLFIEIATVDRCGAEICFNLAEEAAEKENCPDRKAQFKRSICDARDKALLKQIPQK